MRGDSIYHLTVLTTELTGPIDRNIEGKGSPELGTVGTDSYVRSPRPGVTMKSCYDRAVQVLVMLSQLSHQNVRGELATTIEGLS